MAELANFNGQQVEVGDQFKAGVQSGADIWNKATGQSLTSEQYDRMLNPTTAGARYGDKDPNPPGATPGGLLYSGMTPPTAATYSATEQTVGDRSTVQNQIANITGNGSRLNTMAATEANKEMASRGLLNSSIAVGAAQDAVLKNALPIAQQDANTYAGADAANAQFKNSADQFNAGAKNTLTGQLISSDTTLKATSMNNASQQLISDRDNQTKLQLQNLDTEAKKAMAVLDEGTKVKLQSLDAADKQLLQTNISAANAYAQLAQALANISTSTTMDAAGKQQATDNQIALFRQNLQALGQVSNLDLSKYFQQVSTSEQTGTDAAKSAQNATNLSNAQAAMRGIVS